MKKFNLATLCLGLLFSACKKDYQPNINSVVKGRFYDSTNKVPIPKVTVEVGEYQSKTINFERDYTLNSYVGSATTDANGNYTINFKTSGHGNYYFLTYTNVPKGVTMAPNAGSNNYFNQHSFAITNIGGTNTCNVYGFKQYYLQVRMIVSNNPLPPLNVSVLDAMEDAGGGEIYAKNVDTVLNIPIKKNENFSLILNIYNPTTQIAYFDTPIVFSPITAAGDTVQGGTYNIFPATFKVE